MEAIQALLEPDGLEKTARPEPKHDRSGSRNGGETFAGKVRSALQAIGKPASAKEVATWLKSHGVTYNGKATLAIRVSSELYRMAQRHTEGVYKSKSRGKYAIKAA